MSCRVVFVATERSRRGVQVRNAPYLKPQLMTRRSQREVNYARQRSLLNLNCYRRPSVTISQNNDVIITVSGFPLATTATTATTANKAY